MNRRVHRGCTRYPNSDESAFIYLFKQLQGQSLPQTFALTAGFRHEIFIRHEAMFDSRTELVGLTAGICTSISLLPQLIKLLRHKKAEDISLFYLGILFIGLGLWIWYGLLRKDIPIVVTNGFSLVINGVIIVLGIKYKKKKKADAN
jgi:MtN3 and saliva related transmembrane protein